jgi:hypothetical protein
MLKNFSIALVSLLTLSGCAALLPADFGGPEDYVWKVVYEENSDSYAMKLFLPPCDGKSTNTYDLCDKATNVSLLGLLYPVKVSGTTVHHLNTKFKYIGTLKSGQTIQMEKDCSIQACIERPSTENGQQYVLNEMMNGRDVVIRKDLKTSFDFDWYISASGFAANIEKLKEMNSNPTPRDLAL